MADSRDLSENLFAGVKPSKNYGYLGDYAIMRSFVLGIIRNGFSLNERPDPSKNLTALLNKTALTLLGLRGGDSPRPVPGLHEPGVIDVICKKELSIPEDQPELVMQQAVLSILSEMADVNKYAGQPDVPEEDWEDAAEDIVNRYTNLFMGRTFEEQDWN